MKVAVTGAAGQLGTVVLRRLVDDRRVERILALDIAPHKLASRKIEFRRVDVRDREALASAFEGCEAVLHLAFAVTARLPREVFDAINVGGSKKVFEVAAECGVRRMVYASSMAAYGVVSGHPQPIVESTPRVCQDDFPYAAAKYRVEEWLDAFEGRHPELHVVRLRPPILVGRHFGNPLGRALAQALRRGFLPVTSDTPLYCVWDGDVAAAAVLGLRCEARGAFNVCADRPLPTAELATALGLRPRRVPAAAVRAANVAVAVLSRLGLAEAVDPAWSRQGGVEMEVSSERAKAELGWRPECPELVDVFRRYLELTPGRDRRMARFFRFLDLTSRLGQAAPGSAGTMGPVHLCLPGPGGGDFTLEARGGRLRLYEGTPAPPASSATLDAALWRRLLAGETTFATAEMTGRIRLEGDTSAGFLVAGLVTRVRQQCAAGGLGGRILTAWVRHATQEDGA